MSEHSSGSDVTLMRGNSVKGDYCVINGSKFWIKNGPIADVEVVYAKTGTKDITAFLGERDTSGFSVGKRLNKMGMQDSSTRQLIFENCIVPETNILGGLQQGVYVLMSGLDYERLVLAAGPLGIMRKACDMAYEYAHQFSQPIGKFQVAQGMVTDMFTDTMFCKFTLYSTARAVGNYLAANKGVQGAKDTGGLTAKCAAVIPKLAEAGNTFFLAMNCCAILFGYLK